jgi:dipeptidyl aminopeptidase/acylaminoacyl peptidase
VPKHATGLVVAVLFSLAARNAAAATDSLEVLGGLPTLEDVALSPDGSRIAYVKTSNEDRYIHVVSLADKKALRVVRVAQSKLRNITWADNDNVLFIVSSSDRAFGTVGAPSESYLLAAYNLSSNKLQNPLVNLVPEADVWVHLTEVTLNTIVGKPITRTVEGKSVLYVAGLATDKNRLFKPVLIKANLGANAARIIARGADLDTRWLLDQKGEIIASQGYSEEKQRWTLNLRLDRVLKPLMSVDAPIEHPQIVGFSPDGDSIWIRSGGDDESAPLKSVSLKDGIVSDVPAQSSHFASFLLNRSNERIVGGSKLSAPDELEFFDGRMQESWKFITHSFRAEQVTLISADDNFDRFVVRVEGIDDGFSYLLFDAATYTFSSIGNAYDNLPAVAQTKSAHYRAADGMEIPAFITLPPDRAAKNLPLVVLPHGGPSAHDDGHFDWLAQALALQGYAVLQPNYRGSNLNWRFMAAGFGEWGRKMQTDLSDGAQQLVKDGLADPKRICIVGASYGGYAALAAAAWGANTYRCAVSIAGISDLGLFQRWITEQHWRADSEAGRYFDRYIGATGPSDPLLAQRSPLQHLDGISIPILFIHGRDDSIVPYEQSESMATALGRIHKPVQFLTLDHEDHWLSRSETRLQALKATVKFLHENCPTD